MSCGPGEGSSGRRADWLLALGIFALALTMRLLFLGFAGDHSWPHSTYFEGDAPLFADWAATLDRGGVLESGLPLHSPATAYLLHWFGPRSTDEAGRLILRDFLMMKVVWCVVSALTSAALFLVARPLGRRVALIAALLHAISFGTSVLATSLNNECLYAFTLVIIVGLTERWVHSPSLARAGLLGVLHGAGTLLRPEHPLFALLALAAMAAAVGRPRWRRSVAGALTLLVGMSGVCLPWMLKSHAAIVALNHGAREPLDYSAMPVAWSADARAFLESLPAFCRADNLRYISDSLARRGTTSVDAGGVRAFLFEQFGYIPEPISPWVLVSCQGPLAFALANHPDSAGGFTKAALDARFGPDPRLQLSLPSHLRLLNRGYEAGWAEIQREPRAWLGLVGSKLERFARGAALGLTAANWPIGREGPRPAVDMFAPPLSAAPIWSLALGVLLVAGIAVAVRRRVARFWLLAIAAKVLVTIAFFGYARQAASIAPAFFVLIALGIDGLLSRLPLRFQRREAGWAGLGLIVSIVIATDTYTAVVPMDMRILGPARAAPRWGPGSFEAAEAIELRPAPAGRT